MLLKNFSNWLSYQVLGLTPETQFADAINFFIYDLIKILVLLFLLIFVFGVVRTFLPQQKIKTWMKNKGVGGNIFAALFGAITPFCSCSSIPIFLGFLEAGVPLGVTFSFLITSPLINEYLVIIMLGLFGWKITIIYILSGLFIGIISGVLLERMHLEKYLVRDFINSDTSKNQEQEYNTFYSRLQFGLNEAVSVTKKIWFWVFLGVAMGAVIHNYVPEEIIHKIISKTGLFSVPIATLLGVPMYGSCAAIVPIAVVLFHKGIPLGTSLSFMMAIAALSLPEAIMLRRAMKLKLIGIFFGITTMGIIATGYLFNFIQQIIV